MNNSKESMREKRWYLKWWSVLVWFVVVGPFGLPFLWKSKDFNLLWKWILTIAILVITAMLSWSTWKLIQIMVNQFKLLGI